MKIDMRLFIGRISKWNEIASSPLRASRNDSYVGIKQ